MKNVGTMTKVQLNTLLKQFPTGAKIETSDIVIKVYAPNGDQIMSCAKMGKLWHVRAVQGLIDKQ